jgi:hypothetical protein
MAWILASWDRVALEEPSRAALVPREESSSDRAICYKGRKCVCVCERERRRKGRGKKDIFPLFSHLLSQKTIF